ncbi:MAG: DUF4476 domain-containing protein, partial [Sphingobacteriales bacterium]
PTRKFRLKEVSSLQPLPQMPAFDRNRNQPVNGTQPQTEQGSSDDVVLDMPPDRTVSARLQPLKTAMDKVDADSKKREEAQKFINSNKVNSDEVKDIASWIFFDDNRLLFIKAAYAKVSDPANFAVVGEVFTLPESKKSFDDFLSTK